SQLYVALGAVLLLALLLAAFAWYVGKVRAEAYEAGEVAERGRWQARESEELRKANAALAAARARIAEVERNAAEAIAAEEKRRLKEVADAEARKERFVSDVVAGRIRLFDPCRAAAGQGAARDPGPAASAAAPGADGGA